MPFVRPSLQTIVNRIEADMEQRLTGDTPLLQVAFLRILARVFAGAIHVLYGWLSWLADQLFFDTAEDASLDGHAYRWGLARKAATFAVGDVILSGVNGTSIPSGTRLADEDGVEIETTAAGTIAGGSVTLAATAVLPGIAGNLAASTSVELLEPITGVTSAAVDSTGFSGGQNEETDSELRGRIFSRISTPPAGGTADDFERWSEEVSGVSKAWAFGNTPSAGWVTMIIKASGTNPVPSSPLLTAVSDYVSDRMPITTNLSVQAIDDVDIDMTISVTTTPGADESAVETAITSNIESYVDDTGEPGEDVLISGLRNAISTVAGVVDYEITAISKDGIPQSIDDIFLTGYQYPVIDTITYP